ncbi:MAG TPA: DUF1552 domain-containing protein, partial [Kofleriaceae bacterium]|nr:DUF1552 domain-containing protein [Kofleriaceae bacterium]
AVGGETILPSLELGDSNGEHMFSWTAAGERVPYEGGPRQAFDRLFKGRTPSLPAWKHGKGGSTAAKSNATKPDAKGAAASDDQLVIDLVLEDAKALRGRVSRSDQRRLDEYLDSVHALENRIVRLDRRARDEAADSRAPVPRGGALGLPAADAPLWNARWRDSDPEQRAEYFRIMSDLALLAVATDTTRVVTLGVGSDGELWDGVVTVTNEYHHHTLEHMGNAEPVSKADPLAREGCRQIHEWYSVLFAELVAKMKAVDEGGTSLLDNSMVMYTSYMANGGHSTKDYPILFAGRAQGAFKTGRHLACKQDTPVANLYLSMLDRMGAKLDRFGESTGRLADLA